MEKLDVKCDLSNAEFTKKCSISNDCGNYSKEDILSVELDSRLTLKGANGLINGLKTENFNKKEIKLDKSDEKEKEIYPETSVSEKETQVEEPSSTVANLPKIEYVQYESELQMPMIMRIIQKDLSEPYSIYTYRYFIHNWPKLCFLVRFYYHKNCCPKILLCIYRYLKLVY